MLFYVHFDQSGLKKKIRQLNFVQTLKLLRVFLYNQINFLRPFLFVLLSIYDIDNCFSIFYHLTILFIYSIPAFALFTKTPVYFYRIFYNAKLLPLFMPFKG